MHRAVPSPPNLTAWLQGPKRVFDLVFAAIGILLAVPLMAFAAVGIRLSGPGPILYRAPRAGVGGRTFTMFKLRTMRVDQPGTGSPITSGHDPRVFPFGAFLRHTKIDELPQLFNILRGDMSIIGPRPEDPDIVSSYYAPVHRETLVVRPGLVGPGSLLVDSCDTTVLDGADPVPAYIAQLLPVKLALDLVYVHNASFGYDIRMVIRTIVAIVRRILNLPVRRDPPELPAARGRGLIVPARRSRATREVEA